jgi:uncharacterized RDD family membrane protein YckC
MTYVGVGRRSVALFVDGILLAGPFAQIRHGSGYWQIGWHGQRVFWPGLIAIVYSILMEGIAGATIGKFLTGIRVVNVDGTKLGWTGAVIRNVARVVDAFPYGLPYLVGAISVWTSPTKQRLGDRWGSTVVVTKGSVPSPGSTTSAAAARGWEHPSPPPDRHVIVPPFPPPPPTPPDEAAPSD